MTEIWKPIKKYESLYYVSNLGRIKSSHYKNERILKQFIIKGYYYINLSKDNKVKKYRVNRLVAEAFICNQNNKSQVNHKDGIKEDNNINNLEWMTGSENQKHAFEIGLNKPLVGRRNPMFGKTKELNPFYGKKHSEETRLKLKELNKGNHLGENNNQSKLTVWDIKFIKGWLELGYKQVDIAKSFNISRGVISNIKAKRTWTHISI
jgi:hypothetical protein